MINPPTPPTIRQHIAASTGASDLPQANAIAPRPTDPPAPAVRRLVARLFETCSLQPDQYLRLGVDQMALARGPSGSLIIQHADYVPQTSSLNGLELAPHESGFSAHVDGREVAVDSAALLAWIPRIEAAVSASRALRPEPDPAANGRNLEKLARFGERTSGAAAAVGSNEAPTDEDSLRLRVVRLLRDEKNLTLAQLDWFITEMGFCLTPEQRAAAKQRREAAKKHHNPRTPPARAYAPAGDGEPPRLLDLSRAVDRVTYLKRLSAPAAPNAPFPDAVVQDNEIKLDKLRAMMMGYARALRAAAPGDETLERAAQHLEDYPHRLDALLRDRYRHFGRRLIHDAQSRYPTQAEIAFLAADTLRHVNDILTSDDARKPHGAPPDPAREALHEALALNARHLKHNLVTAAIDRLIHDRAAYLEHNSRNGRLNLEELSLRPGFEVVTTTSVGTRVGYGGNVGAAKGSVGVTVGATRFQQQQTGRDGNPSLSASDELFIQPSVNAKVGRKEAAPTGSATFSGRYATGPGMSIKSVAPSDIRQIQTTQDMLCRPEINSHRSLDADARQRRNMRTQFVNVSRRFVTGAPIQPSTLPASVITQNRHMAGRNNQDRIQAGGRAIDRLLSGTAASNAPPAAPGPFEALFACHFPGVRQRLNAVEAGAPAAATLSTDAAPPFAYSGHATPFRGSSELAHQNHTFNTEIRTSASLSVNGSPFDKEDTATHFLPSAAVRAEWVKRTQTNNRMKYAGNIELFGPEKKLIGDALASISRTRAAYEDWNRKFGQSGNPCLHFIDTHGIPVAAPRATDSSPHDDYLLSPDELSLLGGRDNIPANIGCALRALRSGELEPTALVDSITRRAQALTRGYAELYEAGVQAYHADTPQQRKTAFDKLNETYLQGWFKFSRHPGDTEYRNFFTVLKNNFDNAALELAGCMSATRLVGANVLAQAPPESRDTFVKALKSQAKAYQDMKRLSEINMLPVHHFQQKVGDKSSSSVSTKTDTRMSLSGSASLGVFKQESTIDKVLPAGRLDALFAISTTLTRRTQDQLAHINALRLATMTQHTVEVAVPHAVHDAAAVAVEMLHKDILRTAPHDRALADLLPAHLTFPPVAPLLFATDSHTYAVNYVAPKGAPADTRGTWFEGKKALRTLASTMRLTGQKKDVSFTLSGELLAPLMDGVTTDLRYVQSTNLRAPVAAKFGPSVGDLAMLKSRYTNEMVDKNNKLLPGDAIIEGFNQPAALYFKNALFCELNPIYRTVHLGRVAFAEPHVERDYYTEFDVIVHGMGDVGDALRRNLQTSRLIAPQSTANPFEPVSGDCFDEVRKKAATWKPFDPDLDRALRQMSPDEQLAFYAHDPRGREIAQAFMDLMKTVSTFNDAYKLKDGGGYTTVVRGNYVENLPLDNPQAPRGRAHNALLAVKRTLKNPAIAEPAAQRRWDLDQSPPTTSIDWDRIAGTTVNDGEPPTQPTLYATVRLGENERIRYVQEQSTLAAPTQPRDTLYATVHRPPQGPRILYAPSGAGAIPQAEPPSPDAARSVADPATARVGAPVLATIREEDPQPPGTSDVRRGPPADPAEDDRIRHF